MRLLCDTNPMAFGSTASLAAILSELSDCGPPCELIALGRDVSLELLHLAAPQARILDVDVKDAAAVAPIIAREQPDAALVISNLSNLRVYRDAGLPVFFVDILFWYGERKEEALWADFAEGFALNFPGVRERVRSLGWSKPPTIVGPILRQLPARDARPSGTLVNLGGVRSVFMDAARMRPGLTLVAHVLRAISTSLPAGEVVVATGADAAEMLRPQLPEAIRVETLSPEEYDAALQRCALLVTVPGLNAVLEGMAACIPVAFLPALNASQCLQLRRYQQAGVGGVGLELDRFTALALPERVADEGVLTADVVAALERIASSPELSSKLAEAVAAQLAHVMELVPARRTFIDTLGSPGAPAIAYALARWWTERSS